MLQYFVKKCRTRVFISFIFKNKSKCIHIRSRSNNFIISITMLQTVLKTYTRIKKNAFKFHYKHHYARRLGRGGD